MSPGAVPELPSTTFLNWEFTHWTEVLGSGRSMEDSDRSPWIRFARKVIRKVRKKRAARIVDDFSSGHAYWDGRYRQGGTSGMGSVGESRAWKWSIIEQYVDVANKSVLDVGCGDLSFWESRSCQSYLGVDFSETVVSRSRLLRPEWGFLCANASEPLDLQGQVVLCMDLLFHIMDDSEFSSILRNLARWTGEFLFIYNWRRSVFGNSNTDGKYQIFRPLLAYSALLSPLVFVREHIHDELGALYVFKAPSRDDR